MKQLLARLFITFTLWWLVGGLLLTAIGSSYYFGFFDLVLVFGIVIMPALMATIIVWSGKDWLSEAPHAQYERPYMPVKRKNTSDEDQRLNTLLALMDDDERHAFKEALKDQYLGNTTKRKNQLMDGELPFDVDDYEYRYDKE
jgi:hypothetical protein